MHFLYVMSQKDKTKLEKLGYNLLKEDTRNGLWVFENKTDLSFSDEESLALSDVAFILSDILTF